MADGLTAVLDILTKATTFVTGNEVLMTIFCGSLLGMGFKLFKKAKRAVK